MESVTSGQNRSAPRGEWLRLLLGAGIIVVAAFLVYSNTFHGPRVMDDELSTLKNPSIRHLWPIGPVLSPAPDSPIGGRPVLNFSFAINYAISGKGVFSYHLFNLIIHVLAGLVLFGIVHRTLTQPVMRDRFGQDARSLAFLVALLWVVHPALTSAVTYISQRAESLMGLFYLLTIYGLIRVAETPGRQRRLLWSVGCVAACALGMLTKEVMVTAPLMALIFDRTFLAGTFLEAWRRRWRLYLALAATWLELVPYVSTLNQRAVHFDLGPSDSVYDYFLTQCKAVFHYLAISLWPRPLVADYGTNLVHNALDVLPQAMVLLVLLVLTIVALLRRPVLGFAGAWFFLILAPTSTIIPVPGAPIGEHRLYLPLASVLALVVLALYRWMGFNCRWVVFAAAVALGVVTYERNLVYQSVVAFTQDTLAKAPDNERMMVAMGGCYVEMGRPKDALTLYHDALKIQPDDARAFNGLGGALSHLGRNQEALDAFHESIQLDPGDSDTYYNLGETLSKMGRMTDAIKVYQKAIELDPDTSEVHYNLGRALARMGNREEAIKQFKLALILNPEDVDATVYLGGLLAQEGQYKPAIICFLHALDLEPEDVEAHNDLGIVLALLGRKNEAALQFHEALRIDPYYFNAQQNLTSLNGDNARQGSPAR